MLDQYQKLRRLKKDAEEKLQRENPDLAKTLKVMMMMISVVAMIKAVVVMVMMI